MLENLDNYNNDYNSSLLSNKGYVYSINILSINVRCKNTALITYLVMKACIMKQKKQLGLITLNTVYYCFIININETLILYIL